MKESFKQKMQENKPHLTFKNTKKNICLEKTREFFTFCGSIRWPLMYNCKCACKWVGNPPGKNNGWFFSPDPSIVDFQNQEKHGHGLTPFCYLLLLRHHNSQYDNIHHQRHHHHHDYHQWGRWWSKWSPNAFYQPRRKLAPLPSVRLCESHHYLYHHHLQDHHHLIVRSPSVAEWRWQWALPDIAMAQPSCRGLIKIVMMMDVVSL